MTASASDVRAEYQHERRRRGANKQSQAGIVEFHHKAFNQDNKLVAECKRNAFIRMRPK